MAPGRPPREHGPGYYPTMHALAAVQSVLAPLLGVRVAPFSGRDGGGRAAVRVVRDLWQRRVRELHDAGHPSFRRLPDRMRALACPHKLLAPDPREAAHGCNLDGACPFCWGLQTAIAFENALRARERNPDCAFYLVSRIDLDEVRRHPAVVGTYPGRFRRRALVAVVRGTTLAGLRAAWGPAGCRPVPDDHLGLANAVAWIRPYPVRMLLDPAGSVAEGFEAGAGRHRPRPDGVFRSSRNVEQISQCRGRLIAPRVAGDPLPGWRIHAAEELASRLPASWDHRAFVRRHLGPRAAEALSRLAWAGCLPLGRETLLSMYGAPRRAWGTLLSAQKSGEGAFCHSPGHGYLVFRARSEADPTRVVSRVEGGGGGFLAAPRGPEGGYLEFPFRGRTYSLEPMSGWAWLKENPMTPAESAMYARKAV